MTEWLGAIDRAIGIVADGLTSTPWIGTAALAIGCYLCGALLLYIGFRRRDLGVHRALLLSGFLLAAVGAVLVPEIPGSGYALAWPALFARLAAGIVASVAVIGVAVSIPRFLRLPAPAEFHRAHEELSRETVTRQVAVRELQASERRFEAAFDQAPVGMLITDMGERIVKYNRAFVDLVGREAAEILHRQPAELVHADDRDNLEERSREIRGGMVRRVQREARIVRGNGSTVWVNVHVGRLSGDGGAGLIWQIQDIGERKAYEQALREARDSLELVVEERTSELRAANRELASANGELRRLAQDDSLTGLSNRRHLMAELKRAWATAVRYRHPLTVLMMDVDRFKQINDRFGHQIGDRVIASVGNVLRTRCRETDVAGRYGGDELCLVLPHTDLREAVATGEKIRRAVAELAIDDGHGGSVEVTCSIGAASVTRQDKDPEPVLLRADRALYRAKQEGRNRVATWPADDGHRSSASGC